MFVSLLRVESGSNQSKKKNNDRFGSIFDGGCVHAVSDNKNYICF